MARHARGGRLGRMGARPKRTVLGGRLLVLVARSAIDAHAPYARLGRRVRSNRRCAVGRFPLALRRIAGRRPRRRRAAEAHQAQCRRGEHDQSLRGPHARFPCPSRSEHVSLITLHSRSPLSHPNGANLTWHRPPCHRSKVVKLCIKHFSAFHQAFSFLEMPRSEKCLTSF